MTFEEIKALDEQYVMRSYGRFQVAIDHGKGATVWAVDGKEYIDFSAGIGVCSLGYGDPGWVEAVSTQAAKLGHISNLFYTEPYAKVAHKLCVRTGMSNVMFGNSGAEANEAMIKLARKYSFDRYGKGRGTVITLRNSFHGRTITTLAATGQDKFHNYFFPFTEGFRYADANDLDSVEAVAGHDVCAVMMELVQGEGGVLPLDLEFVQKVAELCAKRDWLLLVDEVQSGMGRTGSLFAFQQYHIQPDVVSFAKGIAGGLPFGGIMANEKCREVFSPGTHGTTFGGNPVAAAAACHVLDRMDDAFLAQVKEKGAYLRQAIEAMELPCLGKTRGLGMMIGIDVVGEQTNSQLAAKLIESGLLILTAGPGLRLLPPLTITQEEMDKGLSIMKAALL
ncbi:Acetylornithine aminotransferase [uncultured Clostridium sp.]|uniref:aspartate aminotransferase family protein n=1 Tax=Muriventricola aceti TaxID=2981773 RepID=UPI000822A13A|nr:aspartate aminotransferase family protein [Muriventricola aceti]MCU6704075.1 aspartate aminotransferase family protein [Muriventricola aceti]SCG91017.1 Acetylornithine aminotransferase [uncultured Clostridium sp.]SCJ68040.1 Acetylornithine aminotransferase [uncultured Flavonifractor sp.]